MEAAINNQEASRPSFQEPLKDSPRPEWLSDIDQAWFRGSFAMDEIVFFHRPSGTAIVADLIQTFSDQFLREHWWRFLARLDGLTQDQACAPLEWRLSFINRAPARRARDKVLNWNCQRVIMAHGEWVRVGGHPSSKVISLARRVMEGIVGASLRNITLRALRRPRCLICS